jgi:uncharacterized protein
MFAALIHSTLLANVLQDSAWFLLMVAFTYGVYLLAVFIWQGHILFSTAKGVRPPPGDLLTHTVTPVVLPVCEGCAISGWMLVPRKSGAGSFPAILYFGGRSEEVSWLQDAAKWFPDQVIFTMNYRGYGESGGSPSEAALYSDALKQFDFLAQSLRVNAERITVIGRSLGTGVASYVVANRPAEKAVLITPYDSVLNLARHAMYLVPVGLLLSHRFESIRFAQSARQPCLALLAEQDEVVPEEHARRLIDSWGGHMDVLRIPGSDHCDIPYRADTLDVIAGWLASRPTWAKLPAVPARAFASDRR